VGKGGYALFAEKPPVLCIFWVKFTRPMKFAYFVAEKNMVAEIRKLMTKMLANTCFHFMKHMILCSGKGVRKWLPYAPMQLEGPIISNLSFAATTLMLMSTLIKRGISNE
jgi:hypothetical protein